MTYTKETLQEAIVQKLRLNYGCTEKQATDGEVMKACALVLRDIMAERGVRTREEVDSQEKRKVHYMSMEFLMGRSLMKNAYNLELLEPLTGAVEALGFKAADIFDMEPDAGLGNGGLAVWRPASWTLRHPQSPPVRIRPALPLRRLSKNLTRTAARRKRRTIGPSTATPGPTAGITTR